MNKKSRTLTIVVLITVFLISAGVVLCSYVIVSRVNKNKYKTPSTKSEVKEGRKDGYSEDIKSKNIVSFSYSYSNNTFSCELKNDGLHININGKGFKIDYITNDKSILSELQNIVDKYKLYTNNGYEKEVSGLPKGYGDTLSVIYDSDEKIWKYSNQIRLVDDKVVNEFYELFHKNALDNGYDFDISNDTNEEISKEYLKGIWEGKCSNNNYKIDLTNVYVKIYQNDVLTDSYIYKVINNVVVRSKIKSYRNKIDDYNNYETFRDIANFRKEKSSFYAYFNDGTKCELKKKE